ncbi:MAG: hypothetical protein CMJ78_19575 [Planctomycetaceae bacterium]|nr:hypothetical protein [Planctomycetaceae bacterium]
MARFEIAVFSEDATIPIGHRCMGVLKQKSVKVVDPLQVHGCVLLGGARPVVFAAVDWCEIRNEAYDRWREVLADAAGTNRERVFVFSLHQHDAPVTDNGAEELLSKVGLSGELFDFEFQEDVLKRVGRSIRESLKSKQPVDRIGFGKAKVKEIASNRRHVTPDGRVTFSRGSRSGSSKVYAEAPAGLIDPWVKTISFWQGKQPVVALSSYATHPMSYYGRGGITYDFVGMAREQRRRDDPKVHQIYASGCSGDVTAGKYNNGSQAHRELLANKLYVGMKEAWKATETFPLEKADFRSTKLSLEYRKDDSHSLASMLAVLEDEQQTTEKRILAAMGLSSRRRVQSGYKIDLPVVDFGRGEIVLFPGESFVGYQLMAQEMKPDSFVMSIGYGECWPGYVPTKAAFDDKFNDVWLWVPPGSEARMLEALKKVL